MSLRERIRAAMGYGEPLIDNIGGYCPVQAEGKIDGQPFYFRARGQRWSIEIGGGPVREFMKQGPAVGWYYEEPYGDSRFAAGWMDEAEAVDFIRKAAGLWRVAGQIRL